MSGHWYDREGNPRHFIIGAGGLSRPATLADARKLGLMPGFSGVDKMIYNHFLQRWIKDQAVLAALTLARGPDESDKDYLARIDRDGASRAVEAAAEGKRIHAACEAHFASEAVPEAYRPHTAAMRRTLDDNFPSVTDWVSERTFACREGYGGAIDIYSPSAKVILDMKGADVAPDETKKLAYTQHRQLACYANGLGWEVGEYRAGNIFLSRTHPGHARFHEWKAEELEEGLDTFRHALRIWCNVNKYDTRW